MSVQRRSDALQLVDGNAAAGFAPLGHVLLVAVLDNLGKGAAGAAVQNLNLLLGVEESTGLSAGADSP